jgi:hypothetical protein
MFRPMLLVAGLRSHIGIGPQYPQCRPTLQVTGPRLNIGCGPQDARKGHCNRNGWADAWVHSFNHLANSIAMLADSIVMLTHINIQWVNSFDYLANTIAVLADSGAMLAHINILSQFMET